MATVMTDRETIFTTPKGLFAIRLDDGVVVLGPGGEGMGRELAERVLDAIEARCSRLGWLRETGTVEPLGSSDATRRGSAHLKGIKAWTET